MNLSDLKPNKARQKTRKRKGRGIAGGQGKTSGRGQGGQKQRFSIKRGFEGGQTPLYRRIPKLRGQTNKAHNIGIFRKEYAVVNIGQLERFPEGTEVTPEVMLASGVVGKLRDGLKILGEGELGHELAVKAHAFSKSAREKIEAAGGTVEVID